MLRKASLAQDGDCHLTLLENDSLRAEKEWVQRYDIYRGVTTGFNDAFIVTDEIRDSLIAEDPRSAEIIKPVLRGRDIQRFQARWGGLWLLATFPSLHFDINDFPAVKRHLLSYGRERLEQSGQRLPDGSKSRKKTRHDWFELQDTCAYHEAFSGEKLYWRRVAKDGLFSYVEEEIQCVNAVYMLSGKSLKYLCAVLNSRLISWLMQRLLPTSGTGTFHWEKVHVERLPVPQLPTTGQYPFIRLVEKILHEKTSSRKTQVCELERAINREVYALYDLTPSEILALEDTAT